jgi:uncharacterized glyoxalase superfamily protein PhnB
LLLDLIEEFYEELLATLGRIEKKAPARRDRLNNVIRAHLNLHRDMPWHFRLAERDGGCLNEEQQVRVQHLREQYERKLLLMLGARSRFSEAGQLAAGHAIAALLNSAPTWLTSHTLDERERRASGKHGERRHRTPAGATPRERAISLASSIEKTSKKTQVPPRFSALLAGSMPSEFCRRTQRPIRCAPSMTGSRTMKINPYLIFNGDCKAAFTFYAQSLQGQIEAMMTFGETPAGEHMPKDLHNLIIHTRLLVGDQVLMGSDTTPDRPVDDMSGCSISLNVDSIAEAGGSSPHCRRAAVCKCPWMPRFGRPVLACWWTVLACHGWSTAKRISEHALLITMLKA